ncbi:hypothetical protein [Paenibacillus dendritiformis]|uniref:hypothetical protein n=1 Tax=Paenibacillus dendritiformis TaxID=130049 RepID=UPI001F0EAACC|nr:hypothetical protein [Paenibacillus dendritiformis]
MTLDRDWNVTWTSAAAAVHGAVSYTDKKHLSLVDVMGYTGHAFRMNIDPGTINAAGPTSFPGGYILRRNLCNLGFTSCLAFSGSSDSAGEGGARACACTRFH